MVYSTFFMGYSPIDYPFLSPLESIKFKYPVFFIFKRSLKSKWHIPFSPSSRFRKHSSWLIVHFSYFLSLCGKFRRISLRSLCSKVPHARNPMQSRDFTRLKWKFAGITSLYIARSLILRRASESQYIYSRHRAGKAFANGQKRF